MLAVFASLFLAALVAPASAATSTTYTSGANYQYVVHNPGSSGKQAAIIFLHGSGSCGSSIGNVYWDGVGMMVQQSGDAATIVQDDMIAILPLHPDCSGSTREWDPSDVYSVVADAKSKYDIDDDQFYCSGYSMGGKGTWLLAMAYPTLCKKIIVAAGYTEFSSSLNTLTSSLLSPLKDIPMRLFAGSSDTKQPPASTAEPVYSLLEGLGAPDVKLEILSTDHSGMSSLPWKELSLWTWVNSATSASSNDDDSSSSSVSATSTSSVAKKTTSSSNAAVIAAVRTQGGTTTSSSAASSPTVVKNKKCKAGSSRRRRRRRALAAAASEGIEKRMHIVPRHPGAPKS